MTLQFGCLRERPQTSAMLRVCKLYTGAIKPLATVIQPIGRIRDQESTPSCVGQSIAGGIHGILGFDVSATQIWTGARRRDGSLPRTDCGTYVSSAITEIMQRGFSAYEAGEERDVDSFTRSVHSLSADMAADGRRVQRAFDHHVIHGTREKQRNDIVDALSKDRVVVWTTGVTDAFCQHPADKLVERSEVGARDDGHAMRVFSYIAELDAFGVQNSWGSGYGGFAVCGKKYLGCVLVPSWILLDSSWEIWAIQVKR